MKTAIEKTLCLCLAALFCVFAVSCHGKRESSEFVIPREFDEAQEYSITFWAKNDTNKTQVEIYHKAIAEFEELYPNIKVNLRLYTDYGKIYNDVITNISTDTTPNVCITYPDHIATYRTGKDVVVPLNDLMNDKEYGLGGKRVKFDSPTMSEIVPQFLEECSFSGAYYALPFMRSTEACYINKTYVEKLGYTLPEQLTWDFVWEVSQKAAQKDSDGIYAVNGQKVMIPMIYKSTDNMMIQMLKQQGAGYSDEYGNVLIFNETTEEILKTVAENTAAGAFSTFKISSYPANFLNAGQCVFAIDSTAGATWMGTDAPLCDISEEKIIKFETAVMPIPQFDPQNPCMISQGPSVCIFNKKDPGEVMASWLFTQYLLTNSVQLSYSSTEGYVPVTIKAQSSDEYKDYLSRAGEDNEYYYDIKIRASKLLLDNVEHTFVTPVFNGSASLRDAAGQMIENVTKSVRRKENVDEDYYKALYDDVKALHRLDSAGLSGGKVKLGKLPEASRALIICLVAVWVLIIAYRIYDAVKKLRK
ncbi:MAG: extracellular solute-binding protein [Clostridia bacterium]|nr:extracellular solute-binding protein [Clostridia bacterium]